MHGTTQSLEQRPGPCHQPRAGTSSLQPFSGRHRAPNGARPQDTRQTQGSATSRPSPLVLKGLSAQAGRGQRRGSHRSEPREGFPPQMSDCQEAGWQVITQEAAGQRALLQPRRDPEDVGKVWGGRRPRHSAAPACREGVSRVAEVPGSLEEGTGDPWSPGVRGSAVGSVLDTETAGSAQRTQT